MLLALLLSCIVVVPKATFSWPLGAWGDTALGFDLTTDYMDGYYGPLSYDYLRGSKWLGYPGSRWTSYGLPSDYYLENYSGVLPPDVPYGPYPKTMDVSKENYVRDYPLGGTEFGRRDSVSVRPGIRHPLSAYSSPYIPPFMPRASGLHTLDRLYNPYYIDDLLPDRISPYYRRLFASGLATPRPSSLRTGGDYTFLRR